jgi:hypothetical protein
MLILQNVIKSLKLWWEYSNMSPYERYLQGATDISDLENRIKNLNFNQGFKL